MYNARPFGRSLLEVRRGQWCPAGRWAECSCRCQRGARADAGADAALETVDAALRLRPVAYARRDFPTRGDDLLAQLVDGSLVFSHGPAISRLFPDGRRGLFRTAPTPRRTTPLGSIGGTLDDLFVSDAELNHPNGTNSSSWRFGSKGQPRPILDQNVFYLWVREWSGGRRLALRAKGSGFDDDSSLAYEPEAFVVVHGSATVVPTIPAKTFLEQATALPSGFVVAAATKYEAVAQGREGAIALRWYGGGAPAVDTLAEQGSAEVVAARSDDDVWIGGRGRPAWLQHWDGKTWSHVDHPFPGSQGFDSLAVTSDGTLWAIWETNDDGVLGYRTPGGVWKVVDAPAVHAQPKPPQLAWKYGALSVDWSRELTLRAPPANVIASNDDVWVVARSPSTGNGDTAILWHWSRNDVPLVDLDDQNARLIDEEPTVAPDAIDASDDGADCLFFVSAGAETADVIRRARSIALGTVVVARSGGKRIVGAVFDSNVRSTADEQALKWRGVGLAPTILCGQPAIESLVVDPNANDGG